MIHSLKLKIYKYRAPLIYLIFIFTLAIPLSKDAQAQITYTPQTPDLAGSSITFSNETKPLGEFIKKVYAYGVGITAIIATVVLMIGGFQWIIAGGSGEKIGEAKAWITAALGGLVLALSSYMILNLVNPGLVNFSIKSIKVIEEIKEPEDVFTSGGGTNVISANITTYDTLLKNAADAYKIDCNLLKAFMYTESSGIPREGVMVKGEKAQGLMQVMPSTGKGLGYSESDLKNNAKNLEAGAKYIAQLKNTACNTKKISKNKNGTGNICNTDNIMYVMAAYTGGAGANKEKDDCPGQVFWKCGKGKTAARIRSYVNTVTLNYNAINGNSWGCK